MNPQVIYLQSEFWTKLREDTSIAGLRCLMDVYDAITASFLKTDISDEVWDEDEFLVLLWKKYTSGQAEIDLYEKLEIEEPEENAEDLSAVYLLNGDVSLSDSLAAQYGVLAINASDMPRKNYLFKGDGFLLKKYNKIEDNRYDKRFLQFKSQISYPCNSMILIDPYILAKSQNIDNNLSYLLDALLPNKCLKVPFLLSIFSMVGETGDARDGKKVYDTIVNLISALRKGLKFSLTLYAIGKSEEFHSRMIITNNVLFSAEDGFNIFKENGQSGKNAKFDIVMPRLVGNHRQDMSNYLRWIKVTKERSAKQPESMLWGARENRLFDLV